jgi:hypothetical protein
MALIKAMQILPIFNQREFWQGYRFLFAYWGCCDWFHEKLMP